MPVASFTHFLVKLSLAAPESFLSAACVSHIDAASDSHFFIKLLSVCVVTIHDRAWELNVDAEVAGGQQPRG